MPSQPSDQELDFHVDEIGFSLVSMVTSLLVNRQGDRDNHVHRSQAGFDACLMHMRAIVEFLAVKPDGHIHASHYVSTWDGPASAASQGLDIADLYTQLNIHAVHISRQRFKLQPAVEWDARPYVEQLIAIYKAVVDATPKSQQRLFDYFTEAQLQLTILTALENQI